LSCPPRTRLSRLASAIVASEKNDVFPRQNLLQECVPAPAPLREVFVRVERRVDLAPELLLNQREPCEEMFEREVVGGVAGNDKEIDIALRPIATEP
jgi:hypothetical protein